MEPRNLWKMMSVAKLVEECVEYSDQSTEGQSGKGSRGGFSAGSPTSLIRSGAMGEKGPGSNPNSRPKTYLGPEKTAQAEKRSVAQNQNPKMRAREERRSVGSRRSSMRDIEQKGSVFQCGGKSHARRDCPNKELMVLVVQEEDEEEKDEEECEVTKEEKTPEFAECAAFSARSAVGISSPHTTKLRGAVGDVQALILIDRATHNFIDERLIVKLGLVPEQTGSYVVITGSGRPVRGGGVCRNVTLMMQGYSVTTDFLPLELNNVDVILGIQWLETLGEMRVNWKLQTMNISLSGNWMRLQGEPDICCSEVSLKAMRKVLEQQELSVLVECRELAVDTKEERKGLKSLTKLLQYYEKVFEEPHGLPQARDREHAITLTQGSDPVSVRPFRYPHAQKEEIERQVMAMLKACIIHESISPFSSPVLLVKKKDGSWHFCVDYRALNKATVMDRYPIPMIDQLLDELRGA